MKRSELKTVLKPLIKQCVKEVLLEEGILSRVVAEVARGLSPVLTENKHVPAQPNLQQQKLLEEQRHQVEHEKRQRLKEQKRKVLNATGFGGEIFEGVEALQKGGAPEDSPSAGALADTDPNDAGVDISGIMALGGDKWKNLI
jgi:hypothetical protein